MPPYYGPPKDWEDSVNNNVIDYEKLVNINYVPKP
jgi:hypothetical protein